MKKVLTVLLVIILLGTGTLCVSADEKSDIQAAMQKADYADYFFNGFTVDYVRNFVCGALVDEQSDTFNKETYTQTYSAEAVNLFMEDHFVFTDAMFAEVRQELGYDADRDVYDLPFIGGFGGMVKPREMVSYVKNSDNTYSLFYQTINWLELPTSEYEKMEGTEEYPSEVVYNGKTYAATADGYLCKDGYKDGGLVHTLEIRNDVARFISTQKYTGSKVTTATTVTTTTNKPTTTTAGVTDTTTPGTTPGTTAATTTDAITTTTTLPEVTETVAQTEGLMLQSAENAFPENTVVKVEKVEKNAPVYETVETALKPIAEKFVAYEITATKDNRAVQPDGTVTATFDIPTGFDTAKTVVLYVADDGTVEELSSTVDANTGKVTAVLTHFSTYVVAEKAAVDTTPSFTTQSASGTTQPDKGDFPLALVTIIVVVVLAAGATAYYFLIHKTK